MVSKHKICHRTYVLDNYNTYDFSDMCAITYLATAICSYKLNLIFPFKQLRMYNWFSPKMIQKTYERLRLFIKQNVYVPLYEQVVEFHDLNIHQSFKGFVDCYDMLRDTVIEFKCTNNIENKHIDNMKTNECIEISASHETI